MVKRLHTVLSLLLLSLSACNTMMGAMSPPDNFSVLEARKQARHSRKLAHTLTNLWAAIHPGNGETKVLSVEALLDTIEELEGYEALVQSRDAEGRTVLHLAAGRNHYNEHSQTGVEISKMLLDAIQDQEAIVALMKVKSRNKYRPTVLAQAAYHGYDRLKVLLTAIKDQDVLLSLIRQTDCDGRNELHMALSFGNRVTIDGALRAFFEAIKDRSSICSLIMAPDLHKETALHVALRDHSRDYSERALFILLEKIAGQGAITSLMQTSPGMARSLFCIAANRGGYYQGQIIEALFKEIEDQNLVKDTLLEKHAGGRTLLHMVAGLPRNEGYYGMEALLKIAGAQGIMDRFIMSKDDNDDTAIHTLLRREAPNSGYCYTCVKIIVEAVQDQSVCSDFIMSKNKQGNTALHLVVNRDFDVAKLLLQVADNQEVTAALLLEKNHHGNTVLHVAAAHGRSDMVTMFLEAAKRLGIVDRLITSTNNDGQTAFDLTHDAAYSSIKAYIPNQFFKTAKKLLFGWQD